ncbi:MULTISPECIES: HNH endonuclease family protein [unclassified Frondihabitans]|uniref:HNH endonuclease family protein n=1 Tax=unclassified Frondihabitans TaxID=2626248 RepID=UPI000F4E2E50|nr:MULTISPECIES: HNH endonuclease family protein [unclassified Frondihabitans]RPE74883.1 uncharacterized protein DUF1524 [Frondihabitans sp. PhB153]RPF04127.1 uncharacterized protein DUF1524 [Frondihabitans sp. PhB161]
MPRTPRRRRQKNTPLLGLVVLGAVLVIGALATSGALKPLGYDPAGSSSTSDTGSSGTAGTTDTAATPAAIPAAAARKSLAGLTVRPWATGVRYDRERDFGDAWRDVDHNGCDTRNDILARDLTSITRSADCKVRSGTLRSLYSGEKVAFVRGPASSEEVQIDHLVPLSDAWRTGGQNLTQAQREALANDPLELQAVDGHSNNSKGNKNAAEWLPSDTGSRCVYVTRQIQVKAKYGLWVTSSERAAMSRILSSCP